MNHFDDLDDFNDSMDDVSKILESLDVCRSLVKQGDESTVAIRLQTTGFEIVADSNLGGERISDILNQSLSDYIECTNASLYRRGQLVDRIDHIKVRKPEIMVAGIVGDKHEAAQKRIGSRRRMDQFDAIVAVDRWIVKGRLYMTSHKSVKEFLHANRDFFPIAQAEVIDAESPENPQAMSVAIVNRARVSFMEIVEPPESEADKKLSAVSRLLKSDA
ncbi:MAG: hypothetical protein KDB00_16735 [Planctomycetales bacterium]|nr:hypothetical protein [Planctomycetales bacterium]